MLGGILRSPCDHASELPEHGQQPRQLPLHGRARLGGASVSKETVSRTTGRVVDEMQACQAYPLDEVYAAVFIDAIVVKIRDGQVANQPACLRSDRGLPPE